ncbi:MAG: ParB/RepB/Spo0J family partition protein [Pseudomonadota bacterium]
MNLPLPHDPAEFVGTIPVNLSMIDASPTNPRTEFNETEMASLTESVRRHGVLQPILLRPWPEEYPHAEPRPYYEIVAGERRWRAAKAAKLEFIEAKVRDLCTQEVLEIQIIENLQRSDLHPLEEAIGYERMMQEYGYSAESLADKVHKSKAYIYARIKLTALCHDARKAFYAGKLNPSTALLIARIPNTKLQTQATREITDPNWQGDGMSVRAAQRHLQQKYMLRLNEAPFPIDEALLIKQAGSCEHCQNRTGNQPGDLFEDVQSADVCTDPECFAQKREAHNKNVAAAATARGQTVITGKAAEKLMNYGHLNHDSGLVSLDSTCYDDKEERTYREILSDKTDFEIQLIENTQKGTLVEVVPQKQLAAALKAAGIKRHAEKDNAEKDKTAAKVKLEKDYRLRLFEGIRRELVRSFHGGGSEFTYPELVLLARTMFSRVYTPGAVKKLAELWVPGEKIDDNGFLAFINKLDANNLCLLMLDICHVSELDVGQYTLDKEPSNLLETAARLSVDPVEIRKMVEAEARETAPTPKKAAQAKKPGAREKQTDAQTPKVDEAPESEALPEKAEDLKTGDRVRVKTGLKGQNGKLRKCGGREGVIEAVHDVSTGVYMSVLTDPGKGGADPILIHGLTMNEVEKLPAANQAAPA